MIWPLSTPNIFVVYGQKHKVWVLVFLVRTLRPNLSGIVKIFYFATKPHLVQYLAHSLNDFSNRRCKWENVEPDALKEWKINIFKIIDTRISFYSRNTHLLPPKPKSSFRHLKRGIQDFHMNYVLVPADKAANNVVVV